MVRKILMATMGLDIGGAETHIVELSRELVRRRFMKCPLPQTAASTSRKSKPRAYATIPSPSTGAMLSA